MPGPTIASNFDADTEGWTIEGDVQSFTWQSSGGDPGGHLAWVDAASGADSYWDASSAYLGDKSGYYGGSFSYAIDDTANSYSGVPDIDLTGGGLTLVRAVGQPAWSVERISGSHGHYLKRSLCCLDASVPQ